MICSFVANVAFYMFLNFLVMAIMFFYVVRPNITNEVTMAYTRLFESHEPIINFIEKALSLVDKKVLKAWFQPVSAIEHKNRQVIIILISVVCILFLAWLGVVIYAYRTGCNDRMWLKIIISIITFACIAIVQYIVFKKLVQDFRVVDEYTGNELLIISFGDAIKKLT